MTNPPAMTALLGVPIDCSGRSIGVERRPAALRAAGLVERLQLRDLGDLPVAIDDPQRDAATGIIGFPVVCQVSVAIQHAVRAPLEQGYRPAGRFEREPGRFWLHLDLDLLDQDVFPAVDYRMPDGLSREEAAALVRPLAQSPALVGADVTIYNPTMDPDGHYARRIVTLLAESL